MILPLLLAFAGIVLAAHFLGLWKYGAGDWAPIAVLATIAMLTFGVALSAWLTIRGFREAAQHPPQGMAAAAYAVTALLAMAQKAGLILSAAGAAVATSTLFACRHTDDTTAVDVGGSWRSVLLWVGTLTLLGAILLAVLDVVHIRYVIATMGGGPVGDGVAVSQRTASMIVVMLLCGVVVMAGSGLAATVGVFTVRHEAASRFQAKAASVLLSILTVCLLASSLGHALSIWDLQHVHVIPVIRRGACGSGNRGVPA